MTTLSTSAKSTMRASLAVIVSNDPTHIQVLSGLLSKQGIDVKEYDNVSDALAGMFNCAAPDLIITDLCLQGISGLMFCRLLRSPEHASLNNVPVMVVTKAYAGVDAARIASGLGVNVFIPWPVDRGLFTERLRQLLSGENILDYSRALIVDNNEVFAQLLQQAFTTEGYLADTALTGQEAENRFKEAAYEVVVIEHHLPDISGDELLARMRKQSEEIVYLAMTENSLPEQSMEWIKLGASAIVRKPFSPPYLIEICRKVQRERELLSIENRTELHIRKMQQKEDRFRQMAEHIESVFWITDQTFSRLYYVSPAYEKIWGRSCESLYHDPLSIMDSVFPDDRELVIAALRAISPEEQTLFQVEYRIQRPDGTLRWIFDRGFPVRKSDSDSTLKYVVGISDDITECKKTELALKQSQAENQSILASISDAFFSLDSQLVVRYWNDASEQMLHRRREEVLGKNLFEAFPEARGSVFEAQYTWAAREQVQLDFETYFGIQPYKNWYQVRVYPHSDGISVYFRVITERKQLEDDLKVANARLETLRSLSSLASADLKTISDHILANISKMTRSEYGFYGFMNKDESVMTIYSWSGEAMKDCLMVDKPTEFAIADAGVWAEAVRRREPLILNNYAASHPAKKGLPGGHVPLTNLLVVPHIVQGRVLSVAAVANRLALYTSDDVTQLSSFLGHVQVIVDNRNADAALHDSHSMLLAFFEGLDDPVYVSDPETFEILFVNKALLKMLGDPEKRRCYEYLHGNQTRCSFCTNDLIFGKNLERTHVWEFRNELNSRWYKCNDKAILWPDGRHVRLEVAVDITEHKQAEAALRHSEALLALLAHSQKIAHVGSWVLELITNQLTWSDEVYKIFGFDTQELHPSYEAFLNAVHPDDRTAVDKAYLGSVREGRDTYEIMHRIVHRNSGEIRWVHERCIHERDAAGTVIRSVGIVQDITQRKRTELALQQSEALLRIAGRTARFGGWSVDLPGNKLVWSEEVALIHEKEPGFSPTVDEGIQFYAPEWQDRIRSLFGACAREGVPYDEKLEIITEFGKRLWVRTTGEAFRDDSGRIIRVQGSFQDITDQKLNEEEMKIQSTALASSLSGIALADLDGRINFVNAAWLKMHGYDSPDEVIGTTPLQHVQDPTAAVEVIKAIKSKGYWTGEVVCRRRDGLCFPADFAGNIVNNPSGKPVRLLASFSDITTRKQAEQELCETAERLRLANKATNDVIWDWDITCDSQRWNEAGTAVFGWTEIVERPVNARWWVERVHPADRDRVHDTFFAVVNNPELDVWQDEYRFLKSDGTYAVVLDRGYLLRDEQGKAIRMIGAMQDITERKRTEDALRESEKTIASAFEHAAIGMALISPEGCWLKVNRAVCDIVGYTESELLARTFQDITHPDDLDSDLNSVQRMLAKEIHTYQMEKRYFHKKGHEVWVLLSVSLVWDKSGKPLHFISQIQDITEHKRVQEALRRSQEHLFQLTKCSPIPIAINSEQGHIEYLNDRFVQTFGYTLEDIPNLETWWRVAYPEDQYRQAVLANWQAAAEKAKRLKSDIEADEYRVTCKNGTNRIVKIFGTVIGNKTLVILENITERKRTEEIQTFLARTSGGTDKEPFFPTMARFLAESLGMDFVCIDRLEGNGLSAQTLAVWCDGHFEDNVTYALKDTPCGEVVGKEVCCFPANVCQLFPRDQVLKDLCAESYVGVTLFSHSGRAIGLIAIISRKRLENRSLAETTLKMVGMRAASELERMESEESLRFSNVLLTSQQEAALDGILVLNENGRILSYNRRFIELWNLPEKLVEDRDDEPVHAFMATQLADPAVFLHRKHHLHAHRNENGRDELFLADGRTFDCYSAPMFWQGERYYGRVWYFRDITERKHAESERENLQVQLSQAQKMESVGRLAGGVAHDFNNLLSGIILQLDLMTMNTSLSPDIRQVAKDLLSDAQSAASLTRQLLLFSRKSVINIKSLNLNDVIAHFLKMLDRLIGENIELSFVRYAGLLPLIAADTTMMEQVVMNLVVNARDAMPKGGKIIISTTVKTLSEKDLRQNINRQLGRFVCLVVSDTGIGMNEETINHIFEPFFTTKEPGVGTGLGLATVHGVVAQHNGWVEVESRVGKGTAFMLFFPALSESTAQSTCEIQQKPIQYGKETILLVEDSASLRQRISQALRVLGYLVIEAENGQQATIIWNRYEGNIDLMLTDMVMPGGMTGLELAKSLKAFKPNLKVIISSAYINETLLMNTINASGFWFLPKPYQITNLSEIIRNCLDNSN